ncbi:MULTISPECIES: retron St85 family RNA-directed DNA polymerase [Serratia]|uniref:RNA-directed DNA polymerase n=1 Tax=Serratia quinivorans TaxID=137545 RepID=A0A379YZI0_9GAMM|nr:MULTISPECIES: retron St85 family RNA-directed DNA polymerase [Serratia]RYM57645.1 RNA-dependent DNA polymerase [Serratia proteamaculans]CAI1727989.1 Retron-type reverse transcriptase [Serratia quinivorans]SUI52756.1 Retron-type reverse transcriptase [Serratia quinivorans]
MSIDLESELTEKFADLQQLLKSRPSTHYKVYKIPKRTIGFRLIAQPTKKVKDVQRIIVENLSKIALVHDVATAYIKGRNILYNASLHQDSDYLLKLDLEDFFNSITPDFFFKELERQSISLSINDKFLIEQLCFWNRSKKRNGALVLSVGSPSSPFISNVVMYSFDKKLHGICLAEKINYSRYADDMTFSTKEKDSLKFIHNEVKGLLQEYFGNRILINQSKIVYSSKAHNRHITGITLTNNDKLSMGRDKKRYISSLVYKFKNGQLDFDDIQSLKGLIGYARSIEPVFLLRIQKKYGPSIIEEINKYSSEE